jgi:hypothetical protein
MGREKKILSLDEGLRDIIESTTFLAAFAVADPSALLMLLRMLSGGVGEGTGGRGCGWGDVPVFSAGGVITADGDEVIKVGDALERTSTI